MIRFLQTPGRTKKIVLSAMLLFICVSMVWYLVPSSGGDLSAANSSVLAKVGDQEIGIADLQKAAQSQGQELSPPIIDRAFQMVLGEKVMLMEADRLGLRVSDDELRDFLHKGQYGQIFFPKGQYIGDEQYTSIVQERGHTTVPEFEKDLKMRLLLSKLQNLVTAGAQVSPDEIRQEALKQQTKVKLQYAVINADDISKAINPTESEIKAYYDQHKAQYDTPLPEKRKARYVVIDQSKLQNQMKVTPDELQRYYSEHQEEFRVPEQVKASHILIKVPEGADPKVDAAARAKAEDILKQLQAGANFEELAKKNSDDPGSGSQGGSLGWFGRGQMVPPFEQAAFSLPVGQISGIVKTIFGYHIIRIDDKHAAGIKTLQEVRAQIEPEAAGVKAHQEADALAATVARQAKDQGLDAAAAKNQLAVVNADWFARTDSLSGIGNSPEFADAAFSAKEKSPPSEVATSTSYVVFEVTAVQPPALPTYEDVHSKVETDCKAELSSVQLNKKTQELSDRAHALNDLQKAAKELGATVKTSDLVTPTSPLADLGGMEGGASVAFTMKSGDISSPIRAGRNMAVFKVLERQEPTQAEVDKASDGIRETLLDQKRQEMMELYVDGLKASMEKEGKVKVNQQQLDLYTKATGAQ
ncbi:MAG TPA: peptidyl-prolyl cis-trans isomerase [Terriglobales bacterium]|jgi:peptidyl-prolyl cis-trans isomerase D|nr:peptidyl-prolyl cis-trans isomerase [Terriglobales bacterium]